MSYSPDLPKWALKNGWKIQYEDSPGGVYMRHLDTLRYLFAEVTDMDDACGRDNIGHDRFIWETCLVDLVEIPPVELGQAIRSGIGFEGIQEMQDRAESREEGIRLRMALMAEACHSYGIKAPLDQGSVDGDHFDWARSRAMRAGDAAVETERTLNKRLNRVVNKIGSTGRDVLRGDLMAGLRRSAKEIAEGKREPTQEEQIMMKMHSVCKGQTLGGKTEETVALSDLCAEALKKAGIPDGRKDATGPDAIQPGGDGEEGPPAPPGLGGGGEVRSG